MAIKSLRGITLLLVQDIEIKGNSKAYICVNTNREIKWLKGGVRRLNCGDNIQ